MYVLCIIVLVVGYRGDLVGIQDVPSSANFRTRASDVSRARGGRRTRARVTVKRVRVAQLCVSVAVCEICRVQ